MTTLALESAPPVTEGRDSVISPLENGLHVAASEFIRRSEAMPEVKKAELVDGVVYMGSPVSAEQHGRPDNLVQTWLGTFAAATPGVEPAANSRVRLGRDDVPQPGALLRLLPECGGQTRLDAKGYLVGAPELVVEVASSASSLDAHEKLDSYRRAGVREYVLWRTEDGALDWWELEDDEYHRLPARPDGVVRSKAFPGLWLDVAALLRYDAREVLARLAEGLASGEHDALVERLSQGQQH